MKPGDKPWFISIVYGSPHAEGDHTVYLLKSLYFLQRDWGQEINIGIISSTDELVREAFEFRGIPQSIFIKDGKTYYMNWSQIGINRILEFIERPEAITEDAFVTL